MADQYVLGQGKVFFDEIDLVTKKAKGKARFVGNVPEDGFVITPGVQAVEHFESYTGYNRKDARLETQQMGTLTVRLEDINKENLAVAMFGESLTVAAGTVSAEPHTAHLGYSFHLNRINLTSFTSLTSTGGSPTTYVNGTDYQVVNLKTGEIFIPAGSAIPDASAVRANYVAGSMDRVTAFSRTNTEIWVRFNGLNMTNQLSPVVAEVFKARFSPAAALDFIKNSFPGMQLELQGEALFEPLLETAEGFEGGMFRILQV